MMTQFSNGFSLPVVAHENRVQIEDDVGESTATTVSTKQPKKPCCSSCSKTNRRQSPSNDSPRLEQIYPPGGNQGKLKARPEDRNGNSKKWDRKWKYFTGNNKFYCEGRVMTAPSIRYFLFCTTLILVTVTLFMVFDVPFLTRRFTVAIPIIASVLLVIVLVNMLRTTCSDPGILPRASRDEVESLEKSYENSSASRPPPRTKDIIVKGQTVKSKYCFTCKMFRPPRASHCSVCDNCVDRFDHHCPFLGNCIGRRNYKSFYFFVVSLSLLAIFILALTIAHLAILSKERGNFLEALRESPTSAVVVLISFFGMWTVLGLAGFHTYLICVEQTTNEDIKGLFGKPNSNPYSRGSTLQNCCFLLCGPIPPSLIDPRGRANSDFLRGLSKPVSLAQLEEPIRPTSSVAGSISPHSREYPSVSSAAGNRHTNMSTDASKTGLKNLTPSKVGYLQQQSGHLKLPNTTNGNANVLVRPTTSPSSFNSLANGVDAKIVAPKSGTFPDSTRIGKTPHMEDQSCGDGINYYSSLSSQEVLSGKIGQTSAEVVVELQAPVQTNGLVRSNRTEDRQSEELDSLTMINSPLHLDSIM